MNLKQLDREIKKSYIINYLYNKLARYSMKYTSPFSIIMHLIFCMFNSKFIEPFVNNRKEKSNYLNILFILEGGLGDLIINLNYVYHFYKTFTDINICISAYNTHIINVLTPSFKIISKKYNPKEYDIIISLMRCPIIHKCNVYRAEKINSQILDFISKYIEFQNKYNIFLSIVAYQDTITNNIYATNIKRYHQCDLLDFFKISEDFILPCNVGELELIQTKFNIKNKFITVNREVGHEGLVESTKLLPLQKFRYLINKIKKEFPSYQIIEVGTGKGEKIGNTDLDLTKKTSLEEIKILMKYATLHIDNEGGLVHLRHLVKGGKSVVFFGPTSKDIYGYSENENIVSKACPINCELYSKKWQYQCLLGGHKCMENIDMDQVFNRIKKIL